MDSLRQGTGVYLQGGSVDSVFSSVSALCHRLSSRFSDDAGRREYIFRELRKLAYSYLLKKRISSIEPRDTAAEDVPLELFMSIAHRQSQLGEWTHKDFAKAETLMERYEAFATNNQQYSWLFGMGKMLLALESQLSPLDSSHPPGPRIGSLTSTEDSLTTFRLFRSNRFHVNFLDLDDTHHTDGFMCRRVETQLEKMRYTPSLRWPPNFAERVAKTRWITDVRRRKDAGSALMQSRSRSNSSSPFTDEGFSSPSRQERARVPIDWTTVSAISINPRREWETIGDHDPFDESVFDNPKKIRRLRKSFQLSPCNLVKVDLTQFIVNVKALLTGIASDVFPLVGRKFTMKPGLYADGKLPVVMFNICKPLRKAGELFARMNEQKDEYPCNTSSAMDSVIKHYLLDYQAMVLSIPDDSCVSNLVFSILPFIEQLDYLSRLQKEVLRCASHGSDNADALHGWRLLEKLFNDLLRNGDPNLDKLISGLFLDCCQVYFGFIDDWIFEGKWHPDLFFQQTVTAEKVVDRYSWIKMFSFSPNSAPEFIPAKNIFECGKAVHLVRDLFMSDGAFFSRNCRPRAKLVTNRAQLQNVKHACQLYAHVGDDFRSAVRRVFMKNDNEELLRVALEKASADSFKFIESKNAAHELKMDVRRKNLDFIKEELKKYEHHRNIEKLKSNIYELTQDDQIMFCQLQKVIASSSLRYELIERYVEELDRITKKTLLSTLKDRQYALTAVREKYFANLEKNLWATPAYTAHEGTQIKTHFNTSDAVLSEVDSAQSTFSPLYCKSLGQYDPPSTLNEEFFAPKDAESVGNLQTEELSGVSHQFPTSENSSIAHNEEERSHQKAITVSSNPPFDVISTTTKADSGVSPYKETGLEHQDSDSDEESCVNEPDNPPVCCRKVAFNVAMIPPSTLLSNEDIQHSNVIQDSYDRIISDYKRRVHDGTLKPFAHISRFKSRETKNASAEETLETSEILQAEFSKSSVSYHMKKSISYPLEAQSKVMNNLILHKFFVENEFLTHLKRLRDVFFRHNGVSAMIFTKLICRKIEERGEHPETFLVHPKLQNILNLSFPAESDFISLKAEITNPSVFDLTDPYVISCLRITYVNDWPLKLILTEKAIAKYNDVFQFLFSIDRTLFYVKEASRSVKTFSTMGREHFTQLHLHLYVMLVTLNGIKLYTGFCVTSCWEKFQNLLENVKCPEKLYRVHVKYLKNILNKFMLAKQMYRVHEGLTKVLHYILEYCQTLTRVDWCMFTTYQQYRNGIFKKLNQAYENFRIMVEGTCSFLDYYIRQKGKVHLKMLQQSLNLASSR